MAVSEATRIADREVWWNIHDKDEYVCPDCGRTNDHPEFGRWEVHHINNEEGNIVALCQACHHVRHGASRRSVDIEAWKAEFLATGSA